jgi:hypothetical protein
MRGGGQRSEVRGQSRGVSAVLVLLCFVMLLAVAGLAQAPDDAPQLRPIRAELPPTFWEQHTGTVILYAVEFLVLAGIVAWLFLRPVPPLPVPIEVQTRSELEVLRKQSQDVTTLSHVSRCVRRYFAVAFGLPTGELTTAEFCRALAGNEQVGGRLSERVTDFLRQCDVAKFSPVAAANPGAAMNEALELVAQSEARRAELRQIEVAKPSA